ncbi:hypothetical protein ACVT81_000011 [Yersinia enterocolitica]|uniref:hypothetical protein n=1 Tax=Yersinia TaxID=629 RepID=UPI0011A066D7|nr:hypothetical protein [Yersinia kristensenii]EKN3571880.1 hypothetical protein [Yersinia enterocolitica]EKN3726513.1 hypothetical protein [Yersinia enterocolitica]EKN4744946.1 hypothetical protein [Yersinia enterocolitica]EKN4845342.1 hypothetical protein [Yersinia enterocolitica]EKN5045078.1 hypothetical protein [Yersinia enterocolitica]
MAGLTKEQREAKKLIANVADPTATNLPVDPITFIRMKRELPMLPGGPTEADVHPESVEIWLLEEWRISE